MPHDKNGAELKAGDRVTVECVVEEVSATPDHCNVKLKTVEPFHPNKEGKTNWFNTKQVVKVGLVMLAVLLGSSLVGAAPPTPAQLQADNLADLKAVGERMAKLEARVARLEAKGGEAGATADPLPPLPPLKKCECPDWKRCVCGTTCPCPPPAIGGAPKKDGTLWLVKGYAGGVECWIPEGYQMEGWTQTPPATSAVQWDCSSGVCRPVSAASYSGYSAGGSCASGSCGTPAASYGGSYGSFGAGVMSGGGGCAGGSCGTSGGGYRLFGGRR